MPSALAEALSDRYLIECERGHTTSATIAQSSLTPRSRWGGNLRS